MKIEYRSIDKCEHEALITLMRQLGYSHSLESISANVTAVIKNGGEVFVADINGHIRACVCAIIDVRLASGKCGEIVSLVVSEEYRGLGLGKALVQYAEGWIRERTSEVRIRANINRHDTHLFYQSRGYEENKVQKIFVKTLK